MLQRQEGIEAIPASVEHSDAHLLPDLRRESGLDVGAIVNSIRHQLPPQADINSQQQQYHHASGQQ